MLNQVYCVCVLLQTAAPPPLSEPPHIYLTSVTDSLTPLLPLAPPPRTSPLPPAVDERIGTPPHPPTPVFVVIKSAPPHHQAAMATGPSPVAPPLLVAPPPVIKEEILPSEEELLGMVTLEEKEVKNDGGMREERQNDRGIREER